MKANTRYTSLFYADMGLSRTHITVIGWVANVLILLAFALNGFTIQASLNPTSSVAFVVHKFRTAAMLVSTLSSIVGGAMRIMIAFGSCPRSTTSIILSPRLTTSVILTFLLVVCTPLWTPFYVDTLKAYRWNMGCGKFDGTIVLKARPNSDYGSTIHFPPSLGNTILKLFRSNQGRWELTEEDGGIVASYDFRDMIYTSSNSSISGPIKENPIQFPEMGLFSAGEWIEDCRGMAVTLKDPWGYVIVWTGIRLPKVFDMTVCVRQTVGFDALAIVLGELLIVFERLSNGCRGPSFPDM